MSSSRSLSFVAKHSRNHQYLRPHGSKYLKTTARQQEASQTVFRRLESRQKQINRDALYLLPSSSQNAQPQALALLLGWMGSRIKTVRKYADIYLNRNVASYCFSPTLLDTWLLRSAKEKSAKFLRAVDESLDTEQPETIPLIIHIFSGGSLPYLYSLLPYLANPSSPLKLKGFVFDCGPPDFSYQAGMMAAKFLYDQGVITGLSYYLGVMGGISSNILVGSQRRAERLEILKHKVLLSTPQLHMYSERDLLYTADEARSIVDQQKERGATVYERVWQDSSHVRLFADHPEEYREEVDRLIEKCLSQKL